MLQNEFMPPSVRFLLSIALLTVDDPTVAAEPNPVGMVWISGGTFTMGSEMPGSKRNEQPAHEVTVDGFWIDEHAVTNSEFRKFVDATGYKTTAELPVDWDELKKKVPAGTPKPPDEMLQPGSLVFTPSSGPVDLGNMNAWWRWVKGRKLATSRGSGKRSYGSGEPPGGAGLLGRCSRLRKMGWETLAHRGGMGICCQGRTRGQAIRLGR